MGNAETCPRCCRPIERPGAASRFGEHPTICNMCGELEAAVERYGWEITGPGQWPLGLGDLLLEHTLVYEHARAAAGYNLLSWYSANWHGEHLRPRPAHRREH